MLAEWKVKKEKVHEEAKKLIADWKPTIDNYGKVLADRISSASISRELVTDWKSSVSNCGKAITDQISSVNIPGKSVADWKSSAISCGKGVADWISSVDYSEKSPTRWIPSANNCGKAIVDRIPSANSCGKAIADRIPSVDNYRKLIADWKPSVSKMLETCLTLDPSFSESQNYALFDSNLPIYLLGQKYASRKEMEHIKEFNTSLLWFTYRKNFQPIGGTGPTSDHGWGCMLRCGQMLLARALIMRHLGPDWLWDREAKQAEYKRILRMFQDKKNCLFSIHQIAHMGVSEGKDIGQWFGPNTAAQVLKKLVVYDRWSRLAVHVALDNVLITSDVRTMAFTRPPHRKTGSRHTTGGDYNDNRDAVDPAEAETFPDPALSPNRSENSSLSSYGGSCEDWRPLLIIIPLRLGLNTINRCYFPAIQVFFQLPQCIGIIGGRPNHALYFIGVADDNLLYLDPHFCQDFVDLDETTTTRDKRDGYVEVKNGDDVFEDHTYHCPFILSTKFDKVDPSLALGFLCRTEDDYNNLAQQLQTRLLPASSPPLFELLETRPKTFPPFVPYVGENAKLQDYTDLGEVNDSYDEFELLDC